MILISSSGVDKAHLVISLEIVAYQQDKRALFINCHEFQMRLHSIHEKINGKNNSSLRAI
ncbi:hypothetical protein [Companilactobacillus alimentarius]|uniref:Uncharacterized protein n=1 Tax=Companilactobacillus alimentarius DSM 20249 TaxID=1423720 RepID=A0A2K9HQE9_9LACO|nr:hypothetical protein [Companilactobacillus alimentarius]AUI71792.1 hypothetical protein LA20249_06210 [Companilactobacillus alimentarius DSM 20249]MDT6953157.1 hypothetical protein [Companilactobacillus alimentarius]